MRKLISLKILVRQDNLKTDLVNQWPGLFLLFKSVFFFENDDGQP